MNRTQLRPPVYWVQISSQGSSNIKRGAVEWWRIYNEPNIFTIYKIFTICYTYILKMKEMVSCLLTDK